MPFHSRSAYTANVAKQWLTRNQVVHLTAGQSLALVLKNGKSEHSPFPQLNAHNLIRQTTNNCGAGNNDKIRNWMNPLYISELKFKI